jgi:hypothetical protein
MANLRKLNRPMRKLPDAQSLDAITRAAAAGGAIKYDPNAMAVEAPRIDVRGFLDEARGAAAIGQGVADVGQATIQQAVEMGKATAFKQTLEADNDLGKIETSLAASIASEPDALKWGTILDEHLEKARTEVLSKPRLALAQDDVMDRHSRWENQQRHQVSVMQARQTFSGTRDALSASITKNADAGNFDEAIRLAQSPEAALYLGEDRAAAMVGQLGRAKVAAAERDEFDAHFAALTTDPAAWKAVNDKPWVGKEQLYSKLKNHADAREREIAADVSDKVLGFIVGGDLETPEEIDALEMPGLTPELRELAKGSLAKWDARKSEEEKRVNGEANWLNLWKEARAWKGGASDNAAKEYWDMIERTQFGVPDRVQGQIFQVLSNKMGASRPPSPSSETEKAADRILDSYWNDGTFNGGKPMQRMGAGGTMEDDPAAIRAAAGVEGGVRQAVRQYLEAHPQTPPEKVPEIIDELMPKTLRGASLRGLQKSLNFGGIPVPKSGDLGQAVNLTVFGGPNDPDDNGKSAFGGATGPGGREGVAIPAKILKHVYGGTKADWERAKVEVTFPGGGKEILPIADLGTAEWVWDRDNGPVVDLTEGAVEQLGGRVVYGRNGKLKGVSGLKGLSFRLLPLDSQGAPFQP